MDQPIWMNYVKPPTSNKTNTSASIITSKRQAETIFTGYNSQIAAINNGYKTTILPSVFNKTSGIAIANLNNGNTWTNPDTLRAILLPKPVEYRKRFILNTGKTYTNIFNFNFYPIIDELNIHGSDVVQFTLLPSNLQYLDMSNTKNTVLPQIKDTSKSLLSYVDMSDTPTSEAPDFSNLKNLISVFISNTNMVKVPILPNSIKTVSLSGNNISGEINNLPISLIEFNVSNTQTSAISNLSPNLKYLYITDTYINILPTLHDSLEGLYINGSGISELPSTLPSALVELNISRTTIRQLPGTLPPKLLFIDISDTLIEYIPPLPQTLRELYMSNTLFRILPILPLTLTTLDISYTLIDTITSLVSLVSLLPSTLVYLNISNTSISILPDLPDNLLELYMAHTDIESIKSLPSTLQVLDISNTRIACLPQLPPKIFHIDATNCYNISQSDADNIVADIIKNNVHNGIFYIGIQPDNYSNGYNIKLNTTGDNWATILNDTFKWSIDPTV